MERRGGGLRTLSPLRIRLPADPKGPLCTILRYSFLAMDPKIFLKAPWVPIYTNFEGGGELFGGFLKSFVVIWST